MQTIALENKRGFTLIELVIVIVLIGILAATALPKFANLTAQAETAANRGLGGAIGAAASVAHAGWIAAGAITGGTTVTMDGAVVQINSAGWPGGSAGASGPTSNADCVTLAVGGGVGSILNNPPLIATGCGATNGTCYAAVWTTPQTCTYTMNINSVAVSPATTIVYNGATGAVTSAP